ncbi:putative F-box domain-containing protein [Helianthus annuus]|nr:putative F-box domain-containing protein [Helianthus annuus]
MVHDLCEDLLIVEIFSRLPSKSLLRFRSVSKSLCACIGSPDFIRLHKLRSPKKVMIIHAHSYSKKTGPTLYTKYIHTLHSEGQLLSDNLYVGITPVNGPSSLRKPLYHIFGSCNGIICLHEHCSRKRILCLWNPSIRRKVRIRDRPFLGHCWVYGFGFDPIIDDYKLLRIDKDNYSSFVYTLKPRTWRKIASPTGKFLFVGDHLSRFNLFNGLLHWAVKKRYRYVFHYYIMTFDLSSEVFSTIELPKPTWGIDEVTIIKGCLGVISYKHDNQSFFNTWIWVRKECNNNTAASWSVAYNLDTNPLQRVLQITPNDELLCYSFYKGIVVYNPETREQWRLADLSDSSRVCDMITCVDSLELLDMKTSSRKGSKSGGKKRSRTSEIIQL